MLLQDINQSLFLSLNAQSLPPAYGLIKLVAKGTALLLPALLAVLWLWGGEARRHIALRAAAATVVALAIGTLISLVWYEDRPFVLDLGRQYLDHAADASFPSDHATIFAAIGFTLLAAETRRLGLVTLLVGLLTGWSRVYLGIHFPFDILGGFVVGYAAARITAVLWRRFGEILARPVTRVYRALFSPFITRGWVKP